MLNVLFLLIGILFLIFSTTKLKLHPFLALLFTAIGFGFLSDMPLTNMVEMVNGEEQIVAMGIV